jgi:tetratricopeptide (TPR) repeat protein
MRAIQRLTGAVCMGLVIAGTARAADMSPDAHRQAARSRALLEAEATLDVPQRPTAHELVVETRLLPATKRRQRLDAELVRHPDDLVAVLLRAEAEVAVGDAVGALTDLNRVIDATPTHDNAFVFTLRSEALIQLGRCDEALADAERAMAADGDYSDARLARGWARYFSGDFAGALSDIDKVSAAEPGDGVALARRGLVLIALGQSHNTMAGRNGEINLGLIVVKFFSDATLDPHLPQAWSLRARMDIQRGQVDEAIADASQALDVAGSDDAHGDAYLIRAEAWFRKGDYDRFLADLSQGSALQPKRADLIAMRSAYEMRQQQWPQAKATLTRALAVDPECAECLSRRAVAQARLGEQALALADAEAGLALAPKSALSHSLFGETWQVLGDQARAVDELDAALDINPEDDDIRLSRAFSQSELGDRGGAVMAYTGLLERNRVSSPGDVFLNRGVARFHMGEISLAAADFRSATAALPHDPRSPRNLGVALDRMGDLAGAADAYRQSLERRADPTTSASLGRVLMFSGRFAEAVEPVRTWRRTSQSPSNYPSLEIHVLRVRAQPSDEPAAREELAAMTHGHDPRDWSDSLVEYMLGNIDAPALLQRVGNGPADELSGRQCEADYYIAEMNLAHGQRAPALPLLTEAVKICPPKYFEAGAAKAELNLQSAAEAAR